MNQGVTLSTSCTGYGLLHPSHHGFRSNHNCCTAILEMYDQWMDALEDNEITTVDSEMFIKKLKLYGFQNIALNG